MSDLTVALVIWLPLGTVVPLVIARLTGSDWRGALIEASLFATMGLVIYPFLLALLVATVIRNPNVDVLFAISFLLAVGTALLFRRKANQRRHYRW